MEQVIKISRFILDSFVHIWPYLIITIPLAVVVKLSGASRFINKVLGKNPIVSIVLATAVGAFSPFCSCGVIPVIASLLIGGVPLAPVMSFWIASPSMDPEIFLLSVATIGWKLSIWRLVATFLISLFAGYITHFAVQKKLLGENVLRENSYSPFKISWNKIFSKRLNWLKGVLSFKSEEKKVNIRLITKSHSIQNGNINCCVSVNALSVVQQSKLRNPENEVCNSATCNSSKDSLYKKIINETWKASLTVAKLMALAFFINALIQFYVPQELIAKLMGRGGAFTVVIASLIGIPFYTSNITALPLISGLLELGMSPGAALAFLIAGPVTTLPAMAAVWGLVHRKIFIMYISFALFGAVLFGFLYNFIA